MYQLSLAAERTFIIQPSPYFLFVPIKTTQVQEIIFMVSPNYAPTPDTGTLCPALSQSRLCWVMLKIPFSD
jgi:hypothetical protein